MAFVRKIKRQPGQKKIRNVVEGKVAGGATPKITLAKNLQVPDRCGHQSSAHSFPWSPLPPRREPQQTHDTHSAKHLSPAIFRNKHPCTKRAHRGAELQSRRHHAVGNSPVLRWYMLRDHLGRARERHRFPYAK